MKKIKMRFSYFLIAGLIGFILEIASFFSFTRTDLKNTSLTTSSGVDNFTSFCASSYVYMIGAFFLLAFGIGIIICSKKNFISRTGGILLSIAKGLNISNIIAFLCFGNVNRTSLFSNEHINSMNAFSNIYFISVLLSTFALFLVSLGMYKENRHGSLTKYSSLVSLCTNAFVFLILTFSLVSAYSFKLYDILTKMMEPNKALRTPFELKYATMNTFSLGHLKGIINLAEQISSYDGVGALAEDFSSIHTYAVMASAIIISYLVNVFTNLISYGLVMVESFDIKNDDTSMEI